MAMKIKKMKAIDFSCASPSSTAICSSLDQHSMVKNTTKSFQRLNTYLADNYKTIKTTPSSPPCTISELPFTPRPSSYYTYRDKTRKPISSQLNHTDVFTPRRRRSSADVTDIKHYKYHKYNLLGESRYLDSLSENETRRNYKGYEYVPSTPVFGSETRKSTSRVEARRFGSMLDEEKEKIRKHFTLIDVGDDDDDQMKVKKTGETCYDGHSNIQRQTKTCRNDSLVKRTSSSAPSRDQVVVLRVSLHCKGCENKLRKHLFKMQGIRSYDIDMETKKVTVIGNVTPLEVLTSISKVKNAQFWPSQASLTPSSISSSSSSSTSTMDFN